MIEEFINYISKYPSAWTGHALLSIEIVKNFKPEVIVDLGVDFGFSTFCLAYSKIGKIYGVDWFMGDIHTGHRNTYEIVLEQCDYLSKNFDINNIEIIKQNFDILSEIWDKKIDLLHIDGLHTYEAVKNDFNNWSKFTDNKSVILFHDVESFKETVGKFFNELDGYKIINNGSAGLGIYTKDKKVFNTLKELVYIK
jgi:hypothetical protein